MQEYIIIGDSLRDTMYCYHYVLQLMGDKVTYASQRERKIYINNCILRFMSEEIYWRSGAKGNRAETISCYYVERQLDRYKILKGE